MEKGRLLLIDANSILNRAFFGLYGRQNLTAPDGTPTGALFAFLNMYFRFLEDIQPTHVLAAFDRREPTFRHDRYDEYKGTRKPMPDDLAIQTPLLRELLDAMHIAWCDLKGYEADDLIGTYAAHGKREGYEVVILTGDKDSFQLIDENVTVVQPVTRGGRTEIERYDEAAVVARYGIKPSQFVDLKALMGDPSDNIPGVRGIGEKGAMQLIAAHGSLDGVYAALDQIRKPLAEKLTASREMAYLSRDLAQICETVPVPVPVDAFKLTEPDRETTLELLTRLGFRSLIEKLGLRAETAAVEAAPAIEPAPELPLWSLEEFTTVLDDFARQIGPAPETLVPQPERIVAIELDPVAGLVLRLPDGKAGCVTLAREALLRMQTFPGVIASYDLKTQLRRLALQDRDFDCITQIRCHDVMISAYLLNTMEGRPDWPRLYERLTGKSFLLNAPMPEPLTLAADAGRSETLQPGVANGEKAVGKAGGKAGGRTSRKRKAEAQQTQMDMLFADSMGAVTAEEPPLGADAGLVAADMADGQIGIVNLTGPESGASDPLDHARSVIPPIATEAEQRFLVEQRRHMAENAHLVREAALAQVEKTVAQGIETLTWAVEMPLVMVLASMEKAGFAIDTAILHELNVQFSERLAELQTGVHALSGHPFNINSPKQLGEVLFTELGLPAGRRNPNGVYSTDAEVLESLINQHEIVPLIIEYRQLAKLRSTFVEGLEKLVDQRDGRVHTTLNQVITATGRLSSTEPNLQNIPIRMSIGHQIRKAFVARPGHVLIDADYSQIELRLLAHLSGDPAMSAAFRNNEDIHTTTAMGLFNVDAGQVTRDQRAIAKTVNFSIVYGVSDFGLARGLGIPVKEAHCYIQEYNARYPGVRAFLDGLLRQAYEQGFVETLLGRRRYVHELKSANRNQRNFGERAAMNMPIQGTAADLIKIAMVRLDRTLRQSGLASRLVLQVHDELIIEAPQEEANQVATILRESMEQAVSLDVPLLADVEQGDNWYNCKMHEEAPPVISGI